jgi:hypothetical protein
MLSPGHWHERVPKDPAENVRYRGHVLGQCRDDRRARRSYREACRVDLLFYVNTFVWQFNPRKRGGLQVGPFVTWDFQDAALRTMLDSIEADEDLCIEKSREMGASWMLLIVFEWLWHFHPWQKFLLISRNEKAVEDEDPDSLFWKIDFMHRYQPSWLLPNMKRRKLFYGNEDNGSTITGQASTGKAGVGGRATAMGIDEFSQIEEDYEVLHRTSDTTGCRIFNFTHKGLDTAAFELTERVDMRKLNLHWTQHPDKRKGLYHYDTEARHVVCLDAGYRHAPDFPFIADGTPTGGPYPGLRSPWYDDQCRRKGSARAVAMDLDIDPRGSVSQFFDPLTIHVLKHTYACEPYWRGEIDFDKETGKFLGLVPTNGGNLKLWAHPDGKGKLARESYVIGGDVSTGSGSTLSCLSILAARSGEKVGSWSSALIDPYRLAPMAVALCSWLEDEDGEGAFFIWETPGPGLMLGKYVLELGYRNIYYKTDEANPYTSGAKASTVPGWNAGNKHHKRLLLEEYRAALQTRQFLNREWAALDECLAFKYADGGAVEHAREKGISDPSGASVNHGDHVIADALAWRVGKSKRVKVSKEGRQGIVVGSLAWRRLLADNANRETQAY